MPKRLVIYIACQLAAVCLIASAAQAKTVAPKPHVTRTARCATMTRKARFARRSRAARSNCQASRIATQKTRHGKTHKPVPTPTPTPTPTPKPTPTPAPTPAPAPSPTPAPAPAPAPTSTTSTTPSTPTSTTPSTPSTGTGTTFTAPATIPTHTETWAYDDCANGGQSASSSLVRSWVTYAEANCGPTGDAKARTDCHSGSTTYCDVIQYLDTNWIYKQGSPPWSTFSASASESWYQHTPGSSTNRIQSNGYGGGYLINQSSPGAQSFFQSYARANYNGDDGLMMDDQSGGTSSELYYATCGCSGSSEEPNTAAVSAAHDAMSAAMTHSDGTPFLQIDNTLPNNPYLPQGINLLNQSSKVEGLVSEGEPMYNGTLDPYYSTLLDEIAAVANYSNSFVVPLSYGQSGASYQARSRRVQEATILLGYSPGHLADWADLEDDSNHLAVWPEEGIYPTHPVQSMQGPGGNGCLAGTGVTCSSGGHNDVQVAAGVYRREFGQCYNQGSPIGPCAAIVNTTGNPVTVSSSWLSQSYHHEVTFNGGDVQSGGTISTTGAAFAAGSTAVPADDAVMLAS